MNIDYNSLLIKNILNNKPIYNDLLISINESLKNAIGYFYDFKTNKLITNKILVEQTYFTNMLNATTTLTEFNKCCYYNSQN